jgi:transposase-like protein
MGANLGNRRQKRFWPEALKREIVAVSYAPGSSALKVARHYDLNVNQIFSWRKAYREDSARLNEPLAPRMVPLVVSDEPPAYAAHASALQSMIEIDLGGKFRICVGVGFDIPTFECVLDVLAKR